MGAKRPRYTDDFRASCVLMLEAAGYDGNGNSKLGSLRAVHKKTGVPESTLRRWFIKSSNPPPAEIVNKKRESLVVRLEDLAHLFIEAIVDEVEANGIVDPARAATALGITIDKLQLLQGKPTDRTEHLTNDQRRDAITELLDTARARALTSVTR